MTLRILEKNWPLLLIPPLVLLWSSHLKKMVSLKMSSSHRMSKNMHIRLCECSMVSVSSCRASKASSCLCRSVRKVFSSPDLYSIFEQLILGTPQRLITDRLPSSELGQTHLKIFVCHPGFLGPSLLSVCWSFFAAGGF